MTFEPIEHEPDDYSESAETSAGEAGGRETQNLRTPSGRFANFLKASERWSPDLLLGSSYGGRPDIVIPISDMRDTYAELRQTRADRDAATERAVKAEAELGELYERIGGDRWRVRYQLGPLTEWTEPTRHEMSARSWLEDFHEHYPDEPASLFHGYETQWREVPDGR